VSLSRGKHFSHRKNILTRCTLESAMAEAQLQALFEMQDKVGVCGEGSGGQSLGTFTDSHRL